MPTFEPTRSRKEALLSQLSLLIDEIDSQRRVLAQIPDGQMNGKPMDAMPSLHEMVTEMARREWEEHVPAVTSKTPAVQKSQNVPLLLNRIQAGRKLVITALADRDDAEWEETVHQFAFEMTRSDQEFLNAMAERMHESVITFRG